MQRIKGFLGGMALAGLIALSPALSSAATVNSHESISVNGNGIVRVIGAEVTAVGQNVVSAIVHLGNLAVSIAANTSSTTKVMTHGSSSTAAIAVGDKVNILGALTASGGNSLTIDARKIRDRTTASMATSTQNMRKHWHQFLHDLRVDFGNDLRLDL